MQSGKALGIAISEQIHTFIHLHFLKHFPRKKVFGGPFSWQYTYNCSFSQNYDLVSPLTTHTSVNFIRKWRDLQFNVDSKRETFSWQFYLL